MDLPGRRAVIQSLDLREKHLRDLLWQLEDPRGGINDDQDLLDEFEYGLTCLKTQLGVYLEYLGLHRCRDELGENWERFKNEGLTQVRYLPGPGVSISDVEVYLGVISGAVKALIADDSEAGIHTASIAWLEQLLGRTAYILERRGVEPTKEADVQQIMDEYMETIYGADFRRHFNIPGVVKNFRPDAGVVSLEAAIEFKFVDSAEEFKKAVSGLFEDAGGYKGSRDWSHFYSVIYMTGAFGTAEQAIEAFGVAEMVDWKPILVTGRGERKKKAKK